MDTFDWLFAELSLFFVSRYGWWSLLWSFLGLPCWVLSVAFCAQGAAWRLSFWFTAIIRGIRHLKGHS